MRDNHDRMPEIVDAFEREGTYFALIGIELGGPSKRFQFGVSRGGYCALKKILQLRPFDLRPGVENRYFFVSSYGKVPGSLEYNTSIRVEQHRDGKQFEVTVLKDLLANLVWFSKIKDFNEAAHLLEMKLPVVSEREI